MLKIKDSVSLSELEKFGFEHNVEYKFYCWRKEDNKKNSLVKSGFSNIETETYILINEEDRELYCCLGIITDGLNDTTRDVFGLEVLFDLIKADLVEKVENE